MFTSKIEALKAIYEAFEKEAAEYKQGAVCKSGCAFCCTSVGNVDVTTLEALVIREGISRFSKALQAMMKKKVAQNRLIKEKRNIAQCPFLKDDSTCLIYDMRPFSCRQLYSLRECGEQGPTIHRQSVELAKAGVKKLQLLDDTGYSGHISFILYLLDQSRFRKLYLSGGFDPAQIAPYGKTHRIAINRFVLGRRR
jgi:Fe-S-cluster containining protein